MSDVSAVREIVLEVVSPDNARQHVRIQQSPFLIGRGEPINHLSIPDMRISRNCLAVMSEGVGCYVEDRGHHRGIFVNGEKIERRMLEDGDVISFGFEDSYKLVFHGAAADETPSIQNLLSRMENMSGDASSGGLEKLNLLLEATMLLHSQLPLDAVLESMLDRAISVTDADRGLLLETDASGALLAKLARRRGAQSMPVEGFSPSQTAVNSCLQRQSAVVTEDLHLADEQFQAAQSIIAQRLRAVVAIPLYTAPRGNQTMTILAADRGEFLGVLYLDSQRPAAFSKLDRMILDAIAIESASILEKARLVQRERERQYIEQELAIARNIQKALLPRKLWDLPHVTVSGMNKQCREVGGDYFDVFAVDENRIAFLIGDVSGKGLGAALLTPMIQGALSGMTIGADPARVVQHLNQFLCERSGVGRHATLFFGVLDRDGNLEYLRAGHPSPLVLQRGEVKELASGGSFPVGLLPDAEYSAERAKLEPGDTLVLYSDGVTEAESPDLQQFGDERLQEILRGPEKPLDEIERKIEEAVEKFARGADQADDITLLLVRYRGAAKEATAAS